ncbi:hypothetical protein BDV95DRAFT_230550 [Massariosphaeria phaeospora]|uniref:Zn(2)-C6 fungal-type domain-containing protein n=1 Tax=Massariosphaeria phaeospora TaxID=100035 RepID=A0A7C8MLX7_9PLEO|nr:hypothetical protein BDV95DRAFT_230550 [Massariosphaeria phaeospora]
MVGVPKSTGCFICRKRKIKCDETWPTCINCQKNGKCCPGPPARHTFKDLGPKLNSTTATTVIENSTGTPDQRCQRLTQLNEKWSDNGAVFRKFRISNRASDLRRKASRSPTLSISSSPPRSPCSAIPRYPSPSQHQELACALIDALGTGNVGHRLSAFGSFIREVPSRIGHNTALDAAAACIVYAHSSMVHKKNANEIANPQLYLRAVQNLQQCLEDPQQGMSSNTLCASVLLGLVEALAGPRMGNRYLAHVGGAGRLMELQGPTSYQEPFARELLRFNRGGIIITSIYERKPCFLTSPQWCDIAFAKTGLGFDDCLYTDILHRMADFPTLLNELKQLHRVVNPPVTDIIGPEFNFMTNFEEDLSGTNSPLVFGTEAFESSLDWFEDPCTMDMCCADSSARRLLINKLQNLKEALCTLGEHLNVKLADGSAAIELPSIENDSPIETAFHFTNWRVAVAYNCFWSLLILTNKIIMKLLPPYDSTHYALEAECRSVALEICKTWEDAWASKPIGAFHTGLSFVMAYEFCTADVKEWILKGLNALLDHQLVETFRWSDEVITMMSGKLAGEGPDLVFSNVSK